MKWFYKISSDAVSAYQYFQVVRYMVSVLVSIIMVKSSLPAIDLGYYELIIFGVVSFSGFWSNGIKNALFNFYASNEGEDKEQIFKYAFWCLTFLSVFVNLLILIFPQLLYLIGSSAVSPFLPFLVVFLFFSVPISLVESVHYLKDEKAKLIQYTHWSQAGLLLFTFIVAIFSPTLQAFVLVLIFWSFIRWLYLLHVLDYKTLFSALKGSISFLLLTLPLILNMILSQAMDFIDSWLVTQNFSAAYFPVFRYGAREMPLSALLFSSLSVAMIPLIMKDNQAGLETLRQKATQHLHFLAPFSLILMVLSPVLFPIVYDDSYKDSAFIFNVYLLILTSRVLLPQSYTLAHHKHGIIIASSIVEIVANIALSLWWLRDFGVFGLAMATVVAYFVQKMILMIYNYRNYGIKMSQYIDIRYYLMYNSALVICFWLTFKFMR
jgi:O-antigen/teichoic acid export membrane protein